MRNFAAIVLIAAIVLLSSVGCGGRTKSKRLPNRYEVEAPIGSGATPQERERERLNESWRQSEEIPAPGTTAQPLPQSIEIPLVYGEQESFRGLDADAIEGSLSAR